MKLLLWIAIFILFGTAVNSQPNYYHQHPNLENEQHIIQRNHIKKEFVYAYSFTKKRIKDSILAFSIVYDSFGNKVAKSSLGAGTSPKFHLTDSNYYSSANLLMKNVTILNDTESYYVSVFEYDSLGKETVRIRYTKDSMFYVTTQKFYDHQHLLQFESECMGLNNFHPTKKYIYNDENQLIEVDQINDKLIPYSKINYEYDSLGNQIRCYRTEKGVRDLILESFYNGENQSVRQIMQAKQPVLSEEGKPIRIDQVPREDHYWYNENGTISESDVLIDKQKIQLLRHYYTYY